MSVHRGPITFLVCVVIALGASGCARGPQRAPAGETAAATLRIGCSTQTTIHVHLLEILRRTPILERNRLNASLLPFKRGDAQAEALREGRLDIVFLCDVPTILNLQENADLRLVATPGPLGCVRLLVPKGSRVKTLGDLCGGTVGVKLRSLSHRVLLSWLGRNAGRVRVVDLQGDPEAWLAEGRVDAVVVNDPVAAGLIVGSKARAVREEAYLSQVGIRQEVLQRDPAAVAGFLRALQEALAYLGAHREEVTAWAAETSGFSAVALDFAARANPWYREPRTAAEIDLSLGPCDIALLEQCARFAHDVGLLPAPFDVAPRVVALPTH